MIQLRAPLCFYPPGAILFCVILLLAVAAAAVPYVLRRFEVIERALAVCLAATGLATVLIPLLFMKAPFDPETIGYGRSFGEFLAILAAVTLLSLGAAMAFGGTVFPLSLAWSGSRRDKRDAASKLGQLLAVNGLGGFVGAEVAYRVLLPRFTVHVAIGLVGLAYAIVSLVLAVAVQKRQSLHLGLPVAVSMAVLVILWAKVGPLPVFFDADMFRVLEVKSGREGSLAVVEGEGFGRVLFFNNEYLVGSSGAQPDEERQAHLPLLLHPKPERVAFIGLGTGITAGGALLHGAVKSVTSLELSHMVAEAADEYFAEFNHQVSRQPISRVYIEDARTYIAACQEQFDVIIGDLVTPWRPGAARLFTLEHFRRVHLALRPGGIFCQWFPMHQFTPAQFEMTAATLREVFPEVRVLRNSFKAKSIPLALMGFKDGPLDWNVVAKRCEQERTNGLLRDPACRHAEGIALLYLGRFQPVEASDVPINTLGNLRLEISASRDLVALGRPEWFSGWGDNWMQFIQRHLAGLRTASDLPEPLRTLPELGLIASRYEVALLAEHPNAPVFKRQLEAGFPTAVLSDTNADWSLWPGSQIPSRP